MIERLLRPGAPNPFWGKIEIDVEAGCPQTIRTGQTFKSEDQIARYLAD